MIKWAPYIGKNSYQKVVHCGWLNTKYLTRLLKAFYLQVLYPILAVVIAVFPPARLSTVLDPQKHQVKCKSGIDFNAPANASLRKPRRMYDISPACSSLVSRRLLYIAHGAYFERQEKVDKEILKTFEASY